MKATVIVWLTAALWAAQWAGAQEHQPMPPPENPARALEMQHQRLNLEQRQSELNFNNEWRKMELEKGRLELNHQRRMLEAQEPKACPAKGAGCQCHGGKMPCLGFLALCGVVHVLLAVWVYQDIRRRNAGSGLWIAVTLLTGFLGALLYAIVRLGDKPS